VKLLGDQGSGKGEDGIYELDGQNGGCVESVEVESGGVENVVKEASDVVAGRRASSASTRSEETPHGVNQKRLGMA
jgi:hypothetical protein